MNNFKNNSNSQSYIDYNSTKEAKFNLLTGLIPLLGELSRDYLEKQGLKPEISKNNAAIEHLRKYPPAYIALGLGPGSFTSLRLALMSAKTLALLLKVPLLGFSSLDFYLYSFCKFLNLQENFTLGIMLDAYKRQVYTAFQKIDFTDKKKNITEFPAEDNKADIYIDNYNILKEKNIYIAIDKIDKIKSYTGEAYFNKLQLNSKILPLKDVLSLEYLAEYTCLKRKEWEKEKNISLQDLKQEEIKQSILLLKPDYMRGPSVNI